MLPGSVDITGLPLLIADLPVHDLVQTGPPYMISATLLVVEPLVFCVELGCKIFLSLSFFNCNKLNNCFATLSLLTESMVSSDCRYPGIQVDTRQRKGLAVCS